MEALRLHFPFFAKQVYIFLIKRRFGGKCIVFPGSFLIIKLATLSYLFGKQIMTIYIVPPVEIIMHMCLFNRYIYIRY